MRRFVGRFIFRCDGRISLRSKELELLTNIDTHVCTRGIYFSYRLSLSPQLLFLCAPAVITTSLSRGFFVVMRRMVFNAVVISSTRLETFEAWGFDG